MIKASFPSGYNHTIIFVEYWESIKIMVVWLHDTKQN